jgi:hypothetical protein
MALADGLGLDGACPETVRVQVTLERAADQQRGQVEAGRLFRGVDDGGQGKAVNRNPA